MGLNNFNFLRENLKDVEFRMNKELIHIIYKAVKKDGKTTAQKFFGSRFFKTVMFGFACYLTYRILHNIKRRIDYTLKIYRNRTRLQYDCFNLEKNIRAIMENTKLTSEKLLEIRGTPVIKLISMMKNGNLKPTDVLLAYQQSALETHAKHNVLTHILEEADHYSHELSMLSDEDRKAFTGRLFGLPVSLSEHFTIKDYDTSLGLAARLENPYEDNCAFVKMLIKEGAIPFVKSNVSQLLMSVGSGNPVNGTTDNPLREKFISGAEACLVSEFSSPLGFATGFGCHVNVATHFCGLYGFKFTSTRCPMRGLPLYGRGQLFSCLSTSVIGRDLDIIRRACRVVLGTASHKYDFSCPPMQYKNDVIESQDKLTIGYYTFDGLSIADPGTVRAIQKVKKILEDRGHKLVPFHPYRIDVAAIDLELLSICGDGGSRLSHLLSYEHVSMNNIFAYITAFMPLFIKRAFFRIFSLLGRKYESRAMKKLQGCLNIEHYILQCEEVKSFREKFQGYFQSKGLDCCICPVFVSPALPRKYLNDMSYLNSFSALYSVLDWPAGVLPVTNINEEDMSEIETYPSTPVFHLVSERRIRNALRTTLGLPICIQCVAPQYDDETALRLMKEINDSINIKKDLTK